MAEYEGEYVTEADGVRLTLSLKPSSKIDLPSIVNTMLKAENDGDMLMLAWLEGDRLFEDFWDGTAMTFAFYLYP